MGFANHSKCIDWPPDVPVVD